jgi:hypothetical protein
MGRRHATSRPDSKLQTIRPGRPNANGGAKADQENGSQRAAFFLSRPMMRNLELLAMKLGVSQSEIVRRSLDAELRRHDLDPDRMPVNIIVSHEYE